MISPRGTGFLVFFALALLLGAVAVVAGSQTWARRRYRKIARALGMAYDAEARGPASIGCTVLPVFSWKKAHRNLMHGTVDGVETVFIEIGEEGMIEDPAVPDVFSGLLCFRISGRDLPSFTLVRHLGEGEHLLEKEERLSAHTVVDLRDNSGFPYHFLVLAERAADVERLRALFPRAAQDALMERRDSLVGRAVHGAGEWVGVLGLGDERLGNPVRGFRRALEEGRAVRDLFA